MTDVAISMFQNKVHTETAFIWEIYSTPLPDATKTVSHLIPSLKINRLKSFRSWVFRYSQDCHGDIKRSISNEIAKSPTPVSSRISLLPPTCAYYYTGYHGFIDKYILAWAETALNDSTFIILNCGWYERIGIRHRAPQTLYLSGLIDLINIQDPIAHRLTHGNCFKTYSSLTNLLSLPKRTLVQNSLTTFLQVSDAKAKTPIIQYL